MRSRSGFTFLEILLVVLILAMVLAAALPRFQGSFEHLQTQTLAHNLNSLLHYAQERAILDRTSYRVVFNEEKHCLYLEKKGANGFERIAGMRGKPLTVEPAVQMRWEAPKEGIVFGPQGESEKAEIQFGGGRNPRYQFKLGEPLGKIIFEEKK